MERRLGRGLGSLLGGESEVVQRSGVQEIQLDRIRPNPFQPRREFDADSLDELRASIQQHGMLQPICVRRIAEGFELIAGERRTKAARLAGLRTVPAILREGISDDEMLELALVENIQREDLNPLERAQGYRDLLTRLGLTQEQVADKVGVKRATVTNHLRLLELPAKVQDALRANLISMGHARAMLSAKAETRMLDLLQSAVQDGLSVRQVEELARRPAGPIRSSQPPPNPSSKTIPAWVADCESRLRESLGTKVRIVNQAGHRGQIVIDYFTRDELERLLEQLAPRDMI